MKKFSLVLAGFCLMLVTTMCFAEAAGGISGIKSVAANVKGNLKEVVQLITALAFVAGVAFAIGGIVKFKAHKENPTQVQIGVPISLLFIGAALIFIPGVFTATGTTLFGGSGKYSSVSGFSSLSGLGGSKQ